MNFKEIFISKLGTPDNINKLDEYIKFVMEKTITSITNEYTEQHHLLPKSKFKEYVKEPNNIFHIKYDDHITAHKLLFEAYNIDAFYRPLNFMMRNEIKKIDNIQLSEMKKRQWKEFKKTDSYLKWKQKRSHIMKNKMTSEYAKELSEQRWKKENSKEIASLKMKEIWNKKRDYIIERMIECRNFDEHKEKISKATKKRWDNMSIEQKKIFSDKMKKITNDENYRKNMSITLKEKFSTNEMKEKFKKRKPRGSDGSKMKELWKTKEYRDKVINARRKNKNETR